MSLYHVPVMVEAVLAGLRVEEGKKYIDATLGGGGHTQAILAGGGKVLGIDADKDAIVEAQEHLRGKIGWKLVQGSFARIGEIAKAQGFAQVDGILFDLGVSSHQFDTPQRGFSYRFGEAPLDLRFDQDRGVTARELVNTLSEDELYEIFAKFGEEQLARPIAHAVARSRSVTPIETTGRLVEVIAGILPEQTQRNKTLSRIFQALRIAVNDELGQLKQGLEGTKTLLVVGGRLVVISFHSLEDRLTKRFLLQGAGWKVITKKVQIASREEQQTNYRARSAKLRVAEKL